MGGASDSLLLRIVKVVLKRGCDGSFLDKENSRLDSHLMRTFT